MKAIVQKIGLVSISVLLMVLTGVIIVEGEQMVDQVKTKVREPHTGERG